MTHQGLERRITKLEKLTNFESIREFHTKFELTYDGPPRHLTKELSQFRCKFMQEELNEYCEAVLNQDLEKQFDALIDLVYVALGTAYMQGFQFDVGFDRVHEANMQKVRAKRKEDSLRGSTYDVIKPKNWAPASLKDLVGGSDDTAA